MTNPRIAWRWGRRLPSPSIRRRPSLLIRHATPQDSTAIWQVLDAAVESLRGRWYTPAQAEAWIADEDPGRRPRDFDLARATFVAEIDHRIVGFSRRYGAEIEALYVHPAHSGQKLGETLLAALEQSASVRHIDKLWLDAALNAAPFYRSAGYRAAGPSLPMCDNGVALPCVRMEKILVHQACGEPVREPQPLLVVRASVSGPPSSWPSGFSRRMP